MVGCLFYTWDTLLRRVDDRDWISVNARYHVFPNYGPGSFLRCNLRQYLKQTVWMIEVQLDINTLKLRNKACQINKPAGYRYQEPTSRGHRRLRHNHSCCQVQSRQRHSLYLLE
jgi:hypothetical protein